MKCVILVCCCLSVANFQVTKTNVLFIAIDDLRTDLGAYGQQFVKTPNIDQLASKSLLFERAYSQVAVCSPSRTSLLTGRRPDTNRVWGNDNTEYWRNSTNATTIPQYFKENGYTSVGLGKIFHFGFPNGFDDNKYSWSLPYYHSPLWLIYAANYTSSWWSFKDYLDNQLPDGQIAENAVDRIRSLRQSRNNGDVRPFFLAVGFHKPHLPFHAPSKYYDLYPPASEIALAENPGIPDGMPAIAYGTSRMDEFHDLRTLLNNTLDECKKNVQEYMTSSKCKIPDSKARELRRAYYACISYVDAQVGKLIDELEAQQFFNDTIIVLWGDHGWHLGEHNQWAKFTNFEDATHVPFMIRVPGVTDEGMRTKALVELIDMFPSLTELAGVPKPLVCPEGNHDILACVEGTSFLPLFKDPSQSWKKGAFSQFPRPSKGFSRIPNHSSFPSEHGENVMGYTVRVDDYRFTEWYRFNRTTGVANFSEIWGTELYNHTQPTVFFNDENVNLANKTEMKSTVEELRKILQSGWRAATP